MKDAVVKGLDETSDLRIVCAVVTDASREARRRHGLRPVSAVLLGQAFAAASALAGLQKGDSRVNLQLECTGALRGLFVDAGVDGTLRGYVKNTLVEVELGEAFRWRAALGNEGLLSVLRDIGSEYYRSSIELEAFELAGDLNRFFEISEQVMTRVAIAHRADGGEPLGVVAAVLVQALPSGDAAALEVLGKTLQASLDAALDTAAEGGAAALFARLFPGVKATEETPARFHCGCSKEKSLEVLATLGKAEIQDIIDTAGSTSVTCRFCATKQEITLPDLYTLLEKLEGPPLKN